MTEEPGSKEAPKGASGIPWELWGLTLLFVPPVVAGFHDRHELAGGFIILAVLGFCLFGLFRRWRWAWWVTLIAAALLIYAGAAQTTDFYEHYGYRRWEKLPYGVGALAVGILGAGLLLSCRLRGAFLAGVRLAQDPADWKVVIPALIGGLGALILVPALVVPGYFLARRHGGERNASTSLKTLATAQADFRSNDRDGNRVNDFWTGDVAGLYVIAVPGGAYRFREDPPEDVNKPAPIMLIELSIAAADSDPLPLHREPLAEITYSMPKAGYWFWAMESDGSETPPVPYRQDTKGVKPLGAYYNFSRYAFLTHPAYFYESGRNVFIINESNTVFRRYPEEHLQPTEKRPPGPVTTPGYTSWPTDDVLKADWSKLD